MNVVMLVISEWWLVEQVYSRQWDSSDKVGRFPPCKERCLAGRRS